VIDFLKSNGVTHIVIGCNAASTVIGFLNTEGIEIAGVIESAVDLTSRLKPENLAVIGGRRTILSGIYRKEFAKRGIKIKQRIAQPLSALIESGDVSSPTLRKETCKILAPIKNSSHILLACTHYPAISTILAECISHDTVLIDPAAELVRIVRRWKFSDKSEDVFYTSGDPDSMRAAARNAFGFKIDQIQQIKV
jgi:glutamate racemase